jgi:hypothetical protein
MDEIDSSNPFNSDAEAASRQATETLAGAEGKLQTVTWDGLKKMLPSPTDQQHLTDLMNIVNAATDHNEKVASLTANISTLGSIVVTVLSRMPAI